MATFSSLGTSTPTHVSYRTIALCLEAARASASPYQRSLEAIFWLIHTRQHILTTENCSSSSLSFRRTAYVKPLSLPVSNSFNGASVTTTADTEDLPSSPSRDAGHTGRCGSLAERDYRLLPSTQDMLEVELPTTFLRTHRIERRNSGEAFEYTRQYKRRAYHAKQRLRHRKSFSGGTLDEGVEFSHLYGSNLSNSLTERRLYRRCRSAVTISDVDAAQSQDTSDFEIPRNHSVYSMRSSAPGEVWPTTITTLLTGGQTVIDRFSFFGRLESLLCQKSETFFDNGYPPCQSRWHDEHMQACSSRMPTKRSRGLRTWSAGISIARPDKKWGGEDAFFTCDESDGFIGVADGVGEWGELGCSPRQFAEELMAGAKQEALRIKEERLRLQQRGRTLMHPETRASLRARKVLRAGFHVAKSFGSSTSIIAGLDPEGTTLGVANIGDSSCLVLRRDARHQGRFVAFRRTKEQQHFFNCPYQLSRIPSGKELQGLASQGLHDLARALSSLTARPEGDTPDMADLYDIRVQEGDLVIVATDGVFDNLFDQEIATLVSLALSPHEARILQGSLSDTDFLGHPNAILPPQFHPAYGFATPPHSIAKAIAEAAFYRSLDPRATTPFGKQCRRAGGYFVGGKMDDITVVVAWIV